MRKTAEALAEEARQTRLFEEMKLAELKANMAARPPMDQRKFRQLMGKVQAAQEVKRMKQETISSDTQEHFDQLNAILNRIDSFDRKKFAGENAELIEAILSKVLGHLGKE